MLVRVLVLIVAVGLGFALGTAFERFNAQDKCLDWGGTVQSGICIGAQISG